MNVFLVDGESTFADSEVVDKKDDGENGKKLSGFIIWNNFQSWGTYNPNIYWKYTCMCNDLGICVMFVCLLNE